MKDVNLIVNYDLIEASFSMKFVDAGSSDLITDNVNIKIAGEDSHLVLDITGVQSPDNTYVSADGFFGLAVDPIHDVAEDGALEFRVVAEAPGYVSTSIPFNITENGHSNTAVQMARIASLPPGSDLKTSDFILNDQGQATENIVVETPEVGEYSTKSVITIPNGTTLLDENNTPLSGDVTVSLIHFNNFNDESLASFPGSLFAPTENGVSMFYSAGFSSIEIRDKDDGRIARYMDDNNTIELEMEVRDDTYIEPGEVIDVGASMPRWSYNESEGIWEKEGDDIVELNDKGKYSIRGELTHLSYWSWNRTFQVCSGGATTFIFRSNGSYASGEEVNLKIAVHRAEDDVFLKSFNLNPLIDQPISITQAPADIDVKLHITNLHTGGEMEAGPYSTLCNVEEEINLDQIPPPPNTINVLVNIHGYCPSHPDIRIYPSLGYWYKKLSGNTDWIYGYLENGKTYIKNAILGETYELIVYYDGTTEQFLINVENQNAVEESIEFTIPMCDEVFDY